MTISSTGALDMDALSAMLEQAIGVAVEKVIAKMTANNGMGSAAPSESLGSQATASASEGGLFASRKRKQTTEPEERVPPEVWQQIFQFLYPSQLSRVSMVCRTFHDIISKLDIWSEIYAKAHAGKKNHLVGGIKPVVGKHHPKDFMLYVCAESLQICELCFSVYGGTDVSKNILASMPLPVQMWRVRAASKNVEFVAYSVKGLPKDWTIRLCLTCRRNVFAQCPESIPETAQKTRPAHELAKMYGYTIGEVCTMYGIGHYPDHQCREDTILARGRTKYGGDVGIAAAAQVSSRAIKSMESRLETICFHLTVVAMDG